MNEVDADRPGEDAAGSDLRGKMARALAKGGMEGVQIISHTTAREVLTPKRRELVATLRDEDISSVRELARHLERDKGQVSRDLGVLAEHGIIQYHEEGRAKRPELVQQHIIPEPII